MNIGIYLPNMKPGYWEKKRNNFMNAAFHELGLVSAFVHEKLKVFPVISVVMDNT